MALSSGHLSSLFHSCMQAGQKVSHQRINCCHLQRKGTSHVRRATLALSGAASCFRREIMRERCPLAPCLLPSCPAAVSRHCSSCCSPTSFLLTHSLTARQAERKAGVPRIDFGSSCDTMGAKALLSLGIDPRSTSSSSSFGAAFRTNFLSDSME